MNRELEAAREQEQDAARLVEIEQQRAEAGVDPLSSLYQAQLTAAQLSSPGCIWKRARQPWPSNWPL